MDLSEYQNLKTLNLITISKVGGAYYITKKNFNPDTGAPLADTTIQLDLAKLQQTAVNLTADVTSLNLLITDLTALK